MAEIMAVVDAVKEWGRTRDFFPALNTAVKLNGPESEKTWTAEDILLFRYKKPKESVTVTPQHDPDHGALGGESLRAGLKDRDKARKIVRERFKGYKH